MPIIKLNDHEYDIDSLSDEARNRLEMVKIVDKRLRELQHEQAILQTARNAYLHSLKELLPDAAPASALPAGDTLKFS